MTIITTIIFIIATCVVVDLIAQRWKKRGAVRWGLLTLIVYGLFWFSARVGITTSAPGLLDPALHRLLFEAAISLLAGGGMLLVLAGVSPKE